MNIIDKIVSPDNRNRKYTDKQIIKILILLQIYNISYRSSKLFFNNHKEYLRMININEIPSFQTLSRRSGIIDLHGINTEITSIYSKEYIAAMAPFMVHTNILLQQEEYYIIIIKILYLDVQSYMVENAILL